MTHFIDLTLHLICILKYNIIISVQGESYLGQTMHIAMKTNQSIADPISPSSRDTEPEKAFKRLAVAMTKCRPEERPTMDEVEMQLIELYGENIMML